MIEIEIEIDPNVPDRRPDGKAGCVLVTNRDIRAPHSIDDIAAGDTVTAVQDHSIYSEPDWITTSTVDEIRHLSGDRHGITHLVWLVVDWAGFHDRPEEEA